MASGVAFDLNYECGSYLLNSILQNDQCVPFVLGTVTQLFCLAAWEKNSFEMIVSEGRTGNTRVHRADKILLTYLTVGIQ